MPGASPAGRPRPAARARAAAAGLGRRLAVAAALALGAAGAPAAAAAQEVNCDPGDVVVRRVRFDGNRLIGDFELANAIVTTATGRLAFYAPIVGTPRCIDRAAELPRDRARLVIYYRNRGFRETTVDTVVRPAGRRGVDVRFVISEGEPVRVEAVAVAGLDSVPGAADVARELPLRPGDPFDRYRYEATRDTLVRRLRDRGYPFPEVLRSDTVDLVNRRARVSYDVVPGPRARIGHVDVVIAARPGRAGGVGEGTVRRVLGVDAGDWFSERDLVRGQRALYATGLFQRVEARADSAVGPDGTIGVRLTLAETFARAATLSSGFGTLDCLRAQSTVTDRNFLRTATRLDVTARVSKVGIGEPVDLDYGVVRDRLCGQAAEDPNSRRLNHYLGATIRPPPLLGLRALPTLTIYGERYSEYKAYLRSTPIGGVAALPLSGGPFARFPVTLSYELARRRTLAEPALLCVLFNLCAEELRQAVQRDTRFGAVGAVVVRNRADNPLNPTRGTVARLEFRHASALTFSDTTQRFNRVIGDIAWYVPVRGGNLLALRLQGGAVTGVTSLSSGGVQFIPPQERLYAGGPTTVRGYRQNELGPAVYTARGARRDAAGFFRADTNDRGQVVLERTVPTGGNTVAVANVELRLRSPIYPDLVQFVGFVDAGQVWNRGAPETQRLRFSAFRQTPGIGVRAFTPIGAVRVDVGYNPHSRESGPLLFAASPVPERDPLGQRELKGGVLSAYPQRPGGRSFAPIFCVTPGNTIPTFFDPVQNRYVQDTAPDCPATFRQSVGRAVLQRLTFNFSIGQAF